MKTKYILATVAFTCLITDLCNNLFTENEYLLSTINSTLNILLKIGIVLLAFAIFRDLIKHCVQQDKCKPIPQKSKTMQEIEKELDEIESSLNAVTSNEKVTPFWELPPKK